MGLLKLCFDVSVVTPFEEIGLIGGIGVIGATSILTFFVFCFLGRDDWIENFWYDLIYLKEIFVEWKDLSDWKGDNSFRYKIRELFHGILRLIRSSFWLILLILVIMFTFTLFSVYSLGREQLKMWGGVILTFVLCYLCYVGYMSFYKKK